MSKYNELKDISDDMKLDKYNFANLFDVVELGEKSYFNIGKTIVFENVEYIPEGSYYVYEVKFGDSWTNISYKYYNTIKLWWIICKFNSIENPFEELQPGIIIKIPNENLVQTVLTNINTL